MYARVVQLGPEKTNLLQLTLALTVPFVKDDVCTAEHLALVTEEHWVKQLHWLLAQGNNQEFADEEENVIERVDGYSYCFYGRKEFAAAIAASYDAAFGSPCDRAAALKSICKATAFGLYLKDFLEVKARILREATSERTAATFGRVTKDTFSAALSEFLAAQEAQIRPTSVVLEKISIFFQVLRNASAKRVEEAERSWANLMASFANSSS